MRKHKHPPISYAQPHKMIYIHIYKLYMHVMYIQMYIKCAVAEIVGDFLPFALAAQSFSSQFLIVMIIIITVVVFVVVVVVCCSRCAPGIHIVRSTAFGCDNIACTTNFIRSQQARIIFSLRFVG